MSHKKNIDDLIARREVHEAELREIGNEIRQSARTAAVAFVDLSDSTKLKELTTPEIWLGYVYSFIRVTEGIVQRFNGTVVKRIGDEVLATFDSVQQCEEFLTALQSDDLLRKYEFKAAVDFGEVFFFKFQQHLEDDPYGPPVDRCARIAKLANGSTVICSATYYAGLPSSTDSYIHVGPIKLDGISEPQDIYLRRELGGNTDLYLEPLIDSLNYSLRNQEHYHWIPRKFSRSYFQIMNANKGRSFLLMELLNVPKLPVTLKDFLEEINTHDDDVELAEYVGYLVEWQGEYSSLARSGDCLTVYVQAGGKTYRDTVVLRMPHLMTDVVRKIAKGTLIRFRGIITGLDFKIPQLDYVDLQIPSQLEHS